MLYQLSYLVITHKGAGMIAGIPRRLKSAVQSYAARMPIPHSPLKFCVFPLVGALLAACQSPAPARAANGFDPAPSIAALRAEHLPPALEAEDLRLLQTAYETFPWCPATPPTLWQAQVAPHTFIDEDIRPWRAEMLRRFAPLARQCRSRREAIEKIAAHAAALCGADYNTARRAANQCAAETLESRKASCTGLSILLAAAYRSVGIPARLVGVAEWGDGPGNHTWVEVWDAGDWHFVEYYPDKHGLDHGWLLAPCAHLNPDIPTQRVIARAPGGAEIFHLPWDEANLTLKGEDRTAHYQRLAGGRQTPTDAVVIRIEAHDAAGRRVPVEVEVRDGDKLLADRQTPGPLDDLNNVPRISGQPGHALELRFTGSDGREKRRMFTPSKDKRQEVVLEVE